MRLQLACGIWALGLFASATVGCGGDSSSGADGAVVSTGGAGSFTAIIDGKSWVAEPIGGTATGGGVPGGLIILGSQTTGAGTTGVTLNLTTITGPGTYALGVGPGVYGGSGSVGEGTPGSGKSNVWETALDGVSGTITITTLSATRVVATFQFVGQPGKRNEMGGTRTVTDGKVDLPLKGAIPPVPENLGAKLSATLNGQPYNAWGVSGRLQDYTGGAGVQIDTHSAENTLSLSLVGVTAPGTYDISDVAPLRTIVAGLNGGDATHCCWGLNAGGDTGTIVITTLTPLRVKGTFSGTIQPQPGKAATAPLVITDGVFDVGIN